MQIPHAFKALFVLQAYELEPLAKVDISLRQVALMDEHFSNLASRIWVFALFGVGASEKNLVVALLDDRL